MALLVLAGCTAAGPFGIVESATVVGTDKTMMDHVISLASGKNCSIVRKEQGKTYCVEDAKVISDKNLYCYRTLPRVTCYDRPDPHRGRYERVDQIPKTE